MMPQDFCFWLKGFLDSINGGRLNEEQLTMVKTKLAMVVDR